MSEKEGKKPVKKTLSSKKAKEQRESASESLKVVDPKGALVFFSLHEMTNSYHSMFFFSTLFRVQF